MSGRLDRVVLWADGRRIVFRRRPGAGPPVVLLHALAGSWRWWRLTLDHLDPRREAWVPDRPGFGSSSGLPLPPADEARITAEALARTGVLRMHVVGHSMGAAVAAELAARFPERVQTLALVDPTGCRAAFLPRYFGLFARPWAWCTPRFWPVLFTDVVVRTRPLRLAVGIRRLLAYDIRTALRDVTAPTCIVWGERDRLLPAEHVRALADGLAEARLRTVAGAGHVVPVDRPAELAALLEELWGTL